MTGSLASSIKILVCMSGLLVGTAKAATETACLNDAEMQAVVLSLTPSLLSTLRDRCSRVLPPSEFLVSLPKTYLDNYDKAAEEAWPSAYKALIRIYTAQGEAPTEAEKSMTRDIFVTGTKPIFVDFIKKDGDCVTASRILLHLSPLPPANFANVVVDFVHMGRKDTDDGSPLPLCRSR